MPFDLTRSVQQAKKIVVRPALLCAWVFVSALALLVVGCVSAPIANNSQAPPPGAAAQLQVTPSSINFTPSVVGAQYSQTLKLSNTGGSPLTVTGVIANGAGLSVSGFSGSTLLNPGTSATFAVQLTPKSSGAFSGSIAILSKAAALDTTLPVNGEVSAADLAISVGPSSVNFGSVSAGKSATQTVALTNTGNTEVTVSKILLSGKGFSMTGGSAPLTLASAQSVTLDLQFSPAASGTANGTLTVVSNASDSSVTVDLSGSELIATKQQIAVSPASINFGSVSAGKSAQQTVTLTNTGTASLTVSNILLAGSGFSLSGGSAPVQLASAQSVTLDLKFSPAASGTSKGTLTVVSDAIDPNVTVNLSGSEAAAGNAAHYVGLTWDASTSAGIAGYNVYRGGSQQGPFSKLNNSLVGQLSYNDDNVASGDTYYYVTTAVDTQGEESPYSNWAKAVIPIP